MPKVSLRTVLHNKTEDKFFNNDVMGILEPNKIKYMDDDVTVVLELKDNELVIHRKSKDYDVILPLHKGKITTGTYNIKSLGSLDLKVETTTLDIGDTKLFVTYKMIVDNESVSEFDFTAEYIKE